MRRAFWPDSNRATSLLSATIRALSTLIHVD